LRRWVKENRKNNVVYFDESGFCSHTYRPHAWSVRGKKVHTKIKGNNRKRTNLIMAQRGQEWLAPMLFEASCTHLTVTAWVEKMLVPTLRPNSLIVFDNAPFHNKPKIRKILERHGHSILPLPRYSPDFNPIEQSFAVLKRQRTFSGKAIDDLIVCHS